MKLYKTLIIDDERLARQEVHRALQEYPEFDIVGESNNAETAMDLIETLQPDIIFLDVQMPGRSGFDLLEDLADVPEVVFTTAYDEYAVRAFEVNALDYLLKPIRNERFAEAIERVKTELGKKHDFFKKPNDKQRKIFIKDGEEVHFVKLGDIRFIESLGNYSRLHFNNDCAMVKRSLNLLEEQLDPAIFFRINRKQIINIEYIKKISPNFNNRLRIVLTSGETLEVSSRQSIEFKKRNSL